MDNISFTQRLVGAIVLLSLAIIFVPLLLQREEAIPGTIRGTNIPAMPDNVQSIVFQLEEEKVFDSLNQQADKGEPISIKQAMKEDGRVFPDEVETAQQETAPFETLANITTPPTTPQEVTPPPTPITQTPTANDNTPGWMVQVASFNEQKNALKLRDQLRAKQFPTYIKERKDKTATSYQVRVGPELTVKRADRLKADIEKSTGMKGIVVKHP